MRNSKIEDAQRFVTNAYQVFNTLYADKTIVGELFQVENLSQSQIILTDNVHRIICSIEQGNQPFDKYA